MLKLPKINEKKVLSQNKPSFVFVYLTLKSAGTWGWNFQPETTDDKYMFPYRTFYCKIIYLKLYNYYDYK